MADFVRVLSRFNLLVMPPRIAPQQWSTTISKNEPVSIGTVFVNLRWCADWDLNPGPTDYLPLRLSQPFRFVVWTIPSPSSCSLGCSPSSLYTFPFGLGSGLASALPVKRSPNLGCVRQEFPLEASIQKSPILYLLSYQRIISFNLFTLK